MIDTDSLTNGAAVGSGGAGGPVSPTGGNETTGGGLGATGGISPAGTGGSGADDGGATGNGAEGGAGAVGGQAGMGADGAHAGAGAESGEGGESGSGEEGGSGAESTGGQDNTGGVGDAGGLGGTGGGSGTGGNGEAGGEAGEGGVAGAGGVTVLPYYSNVPSCAARLACGTDPESCCNSVNIPINSEFDMGRGGTGTDSYSGGDSDEQPEHPAEVSAFAIDKFEVTVGRFREFLDSFGEKVPAPGAGESENPAVPDGRGWQEQWDTFLSALDTPAYMDAELACDDEHSWTVEAGEQEEWPINCVTWFDAFAFCVWDGGRLPTEAEWESVAADPNDRLFPWGPLPPNSDRAVYAGSELMPVGSKPEGTSVLKIYDMAGNVSEWTLDAYSNVYYDETVDGCWNCANLNFSDGSERTHRGGSYASAAPELRSANRSASLPETRSPHIGFRCARAPATE